MQIGWDKEDEHVLQSPWVFWFNNRRKSVAKANFSYSEKLAIIGEVHSIEEFFQYYCYLRKPTELPRNIELKFFRKYEIPMWEDSPNGGCWIVKLSMHKSINQKWERLLFACIGEHFNDLNVIGVVLSLRAGEDILEVWIKDKSKEDSKLAISKKMKELLNVDFTKVPIYYKENKKSILVLESS
jgi:translation initiation factor 4E